MSSLELQQQLFGLEQTELLRAVPGNGTKPFRSQLLKWIGNKQKFADEIISYFPTEFGTYIEPFLGSGGVLGVLAPRSAIAGDVFAPLVQIWETLRSNPAMLKEQYASRYALIQKYGKQEAYERTLASYNAAPNGADLIFLCRACYGGVVRFRKFDGHMSTPVGVHSPIDPESFSKRVDAWYARTRGARFVCQDFELTMREAKKGDVVYCDPPYFDSQSILYGAQAFSVERLFEVIAACKSRGVKVLLSIDGTKYSGRQLSSVAIPEGLFEREAFVHVGRSMLKRFQMDGRSLEDHEVRDRLFLTY